MNNQVQRTSLSHLLRTIGSGSNSSEVASSNLGSLTAELMELPSNGPCHQVAPSSQPIITSASISHSNCNGYVSSQGNPAFFGLNGQLPGPNPFGVEQISSNVQPVNTQYPPGSCNYFNGPGVLFSTAPETLKTGDLDKVDSGDSLSWLADDPPPSTTAPINAQPNSHPVASQPSCAPLPQYQAIPPNVSVDPIEAAARMSGIEQTPVVKFVKQPGDVQFRYRKELDKGTVSPIWADGAPKQYPSVEISNLPQGQTYEMELLLLNKKLVKSVHKFYQTKPLNAEKHSFTYPVTHNQTIDLENIGILRAPADRRGDNELHNSVILGVSLHRPHGGWEVANCHSKEILDLKKTNLRIDHINPQHGFNSSTRKEVTILCSKISEDTEVNVIFEYNGNTKKAEIVLRHHGCALVVRPPTFPRLRENFQSKVRLYCPSKNRSSEPKFYEYQTDPLDNIDTAALAALHPQRDRSPLRTDALVLDGVTADLEQLTLTSRDTIAECDTLAAALKTKMADLQKIRDVAIGREAWSDEASEVLAKAPYILHVQDSEGFTPPMRALLSGETRIFEQLLSSVTVAEKQRLFSSRTCGGATLLHLLAIPQQFQTPRPLLQMMLDSGADPLTTDENGQTVMHWLVRKQRVSLLKTTIECFEQFFRQRGDSPKVALRHLLDRLDNSGQAAIHCAVLSSTIGAIDVLVAAGSNVDLRCPNSGLTALHWAIIENNQQAVEALLARGASANAETNWGATALDVARQSRETQEGILLALRKAGASKGSSRSSEEED